MMNSCLYPVKIMHHRLEPKEHKFTHSFFMFYIDLDEVDYLNQHLSLLSHNRWNVYNFRDKDHLNFGCHNLKEGILKYIKQEGVQTPIKKVMLLTHLRTFGYIFNPVSFYFCFDNNDHPVCSVAEIGNTFREMKPFILKNEDFKNDRFASEQTKYFYISPFVDLETQLEFRLKVPGQRVDVRVNDLKNGKRILLSSVLGQRRPLSNGRLLCYTILFPLITLKVIFLIHFHAFLLYLKKVPFYAKEDNPDLQTGVHNVRQK